MSNMNFDDLRSRTIGTVEFVSSREIKVLLDTSAPQSTAINTGIPQTFPKINGYVLIPIEDGALVGIITWIGIEYSSYPKRKGYKDFDLVDLPFPLRKLSISPVGILKENEYGYEIERGVHSYPSVGDNVAIPSNEQLKSIVQNKDENAKILIGKSPMTADAQIFVNPDKLFGRHIAVLGNTGSGKSCSVAGLIRWSVEAVKQNTLDGKNPNYRFIILDPNGEYDSCFDSLSCTIHKYKVVLDEKATDEEQLKVPAWMWNAFEWSAVTRASDKSQRPLLRKALKEIRYGATEKNQDVNLLQCVSSFYVQLQIFRTKGNELSQWPAKDDLNNALDCFVKNVEFCAGLRNTPVCISANIVKTFVENLLLGKPKNNKGKVTTFVVQDVDSIINVIEQNRSTLLDNFELEKGPDSDTPIFFDNTIFASHLQTLVQNNPNASFMDYFLMRLKSLLSDVRVKSVIDGREEDTLEQWLEKYVGKCDDNGTINIIDLSLIPSDILNVAVSVFARLIFEAHQRYRRKYQKVIPTTLVVEEAHNFIKNYLDSSEDISSGQLCAQIFEKIAKEGRKFGLGLLLSSQRPSELSQTVLSQCNTFLLHRLVNDRDQEMVKRLVPDSLGGVLSELPILPTRTAILLGWAAPIPTLVEMNELTKEERPKSNDPHYWDIWTGKEPLPIKWNEVCLDWQRNYNVEEKTESEKKEGIETSSDDDLPF
jgi:DNA helicase HerA-like ATPase